MAVGLTIVGEHGYAQVDGNHPNLVFMDAEITTGSSVSTGYRATYTSPVEPVVFTYHANAYATLASIRRSGNQSIISTTIPTIVAPAIPTSAAEGYVAENTSFGAVQLFDEGGAKIFSTGFRNVNIVDVVTVNPPARGQTYTYSSLPQSSYLHLYVTMINGLFLGGRKGSNTGSGLGVNTILYALGVRNTRNGFVLGWRDYLTADLGLGTGLYLDFHPSNPVTIVVAEYLYYGQ